MKKTFTSTLAALFVIAVVTCCMPLFAQQPSATNTTAAADQPFTIEYYYKVKWGHQDEFLTLFKKNHLPLLQKEVQMGRMLQVTAVRRAITRQKTAAGIIE